jgi:hypothetical protein
MPPSDYKVVHDHGHHAAVAATFLFYGLRSRVRAWWSRLFNRDGVEGHKFESYR